MQYVLFIKVPFMCGVENVKKGYVPMTQEKINGPESLKTTNV